MKLYDSYPFTSRRDFLKGAAATAAALSMGPVMPGLASAAAPASLMDPRQRPYVTTITPEMIADNNNGWVYYGTESGTSFGPNIGGKSQMKPEEFNKDALVLKCSCYYPNAGDIGHGIHWETFNYLEYLFKGRVRFERYFGQSMHTLADGWKAMRAGLVDIGQTYTWLNQGAFDLFMGDALPFLSNSVVVASQVLEELYPKYLKKEYEAQGIYLAFIPHFDVQAIICTKPIRKMEDLKGKRITSPGGEAVRNTLIALGATPVAIPIPDLFIALQRGTIDGVNWSVGSMIPWRFHEVAKYVTIHGMSNAAICYAVNKEKFQSLPKEFLKELYFNFRLAANHMCEGYTKLEDRGVEDLKKAGVEIILLDPEEKKRWVAVGDTVWEDFVQQKEKKGLPARDFVNDLRATTAKYNAMSIRQIREHVQDPKKMIRGIWDGF